MRQATATTVVQASIENRSPHDLDWVSMEWPGPYYAAGVLPKDISKTLLDMRWPCIASGTLTFVDAKTRVPYRIALSFVSINEAIRSGKSRVVTVRILDYDKAEVVGELPAQ